MTTTKTNNLSRRVRSPEDIRVGDYLAVTHTLYELLPDHIEQTIHGGEIDLIRATAMPCNAGVPMKAVAISLPFVMGQSISGARAVIDTRRHALVKVDKAYAVAAKDKAQRDKEKKKARKHKGKSKKKKKKKSD